MSDDDVDVGAVADLFNVTTRRVQQLAQEGVIPQSGRGRYPLRQCAQAYISWLQERVAGSNGAKDLSSEKAKLARAQWEQTELKNQVLRGELVPAPAAVKALQALASSMRSHLVNIPAVMRQRHPLVTREAGAELQRLIDDALRQVATDGLPAEYRIPVSGGGDSPDADSEAPAFRVG